jgi:hypothetical protein
VSGGSTRTFNVGAIDVLNTVQMIGIYGLDPTFRKGPGFFAKAVLTPDGPGTMRLTWSAGGEAHAEAWGAGASWLLEQAPRWLGLAASIHR